MGGEALAQVGEPEATRRIEHDVVGPRELPAIAAVVEAIHAAGGQVDAFDAPGGVVGCGVARHPHPGRFVPGEAAVVAHVERAIRADGGAVGATARRGDGLGGPVGPDAGDAAGGDLDDEHRAVVEEDGAFRERQALGQDAVVHDGAALPAGGWAVDGGDRPALFA